MGSKLRVNKWSQCERKREAQYRYEVADEPEVVSKARPVKASNGVEDKTKPTISNVLRVFIIDTQAT
jgi:hypothetical protein